MSRCLVLVGLSASGKTTTKDLLEGMGKVRYGVTCTTRSPRLGEIDGRDYDFLSACDWDLLDSLGAIGEKTEYVGNQACHYGILRHRIDEARAELTPTLWILDPNGVRFMRRAFPKATVAIMLWANRDILAYRMRQRGDSDATITTRLANYDEELDSGIIATDHVIDTGHKTREQVAQTVLTLLGV